MLPGLLILACWLLLTLYWNISARSIKAAEERQSWPARLARLPVWLGYILLLVAFVRPFGVIASLRTAASQWLGVTICLLGLCLAVWSRRSLGDEWSRDVELKQGHKLVEGGPYRLVRHPIYTSHLLMGLGTAIVAGSLVAFAGLLFFIVGFYIKLRQEENLLIRHFPVEYPNYQARVKALVPFLF